MGFNSTVVIMNDVLGQIDTDEKFGHNLVSAIMAQSAYNRQVDVRTGSHINAATVVEQHHADRIVLVSVGYNYGNVFASVLRRLDHHTDEAKEIMLRDIAYQMGYHLRKRVGFKKVIK